MDPFESRTSFVVCCVKYFCIFCLIFFVIVFVRGYDKSMFRIAVHDKGAPSYAKVDSVVKYSRNFDREYYSYYVEDTLYSNSTLCGYNKVGDIIEIMYLPESPDKSATKTEIEGDWGIPICRLLMSIGIGKQE